MPTTPLSEYCSLHVHGCFICVHRYNCKRLNEAASRDRDNCNGRCWECFNIWCEFPHQLCNIIGLIGEMDDECPNCIFYCFCSVFDVDEDTIMMIGEWDDEAQ